MKIKYIEYHKMKRLFRFYRYQHDLIDFYVFRKFYLLKTKNAKDS